VSARIVRTEREPDAPDRPLDDDTLAEVEKRLGVKLPAAYVELMREHNGGQFETLVIRVRGRLSGALAQHFGDDRHVEIDALVGITLEEDGSVLHTQYLTKEWELPSGLVLLDGDGHTWIALDYRKPVREPPVIFIESDSKASTVLAPTFAAFLEALVPYDAVYDAEGEVLPAHQAWWRRWLLRLKSGRVARR